MKMQLPSSSMASGFVLIASLSVQPLIELHLVTVSHWVAVPPAEEVPASQAEHLFPSTNSFSSQVISMHSADPRPLVVCPGGQASHAAAASPEVSPTGHCSHA